jgi:hypothetical protein
MEDFMGRITGKNVKLYGLVAGLLLLSIICGGIMIAGHQEVYVETNYIGQDAGGHLWRLELEENGKFVLYDLVSSKAVLYSHSQQYEWKQDQVILKYDYDIELHFTVDGENLLFREEESNNVGAWQNLDGHDLSRLNNGMSFKPSI